MICDLKKQMVKKDFQKLQTTPTLRCRILTGSILFFAFKKAKSN